VLKVHAVHPARAPFTLAVLESAVHEAPQDAKVLPVNEAKTVPMDLRAGKD